MLSFIRLYAGIYPLIGWLLSAGFYPLKSWLLSPYMMAFIRLYAGIYPLKCWHLSAYMLAFICLYAGFYPLICWRLSAYMLAFICLQAGFYLLICGHLYAYMLAFIRLYSGVYPLICWRFSAYMQVSVAEPKLFIFCSGSDFVHNFCFGSSSRYSHILPLLPVLGIRIHMDPELLPGSGSKSGSGIIVLDLDPGKSERADK